MRGWARLSSIVIAMGGLIAGLGTACAVAQGTATATAAGTSSADGTNAAKDGAALPPKQNVDAAAAGAEAAKLAQQAYEAIGTMDLAKARDLLDQAQKLSPDHEFYWSTMGYLAFRKNEPAIALADYEKELALHPADYQRMYPAIAGMEIVLGQREEAKDTLRTWLRADPANPGLVAQLVEMLVDDGEANRAVAEGEAAFDGCRQLDTTTMRGLRWGRRTWRQAISGRARRCWKWC